MKDWDEMTPAEKKACMVKLREEMQPRSPDDDRGEAMTTPWVLVAIAGWVLATAAIVSDWEMRASMAYMGGILLGWGIANCYQLLPKMHGSEK